MSDCAVCGRPACVDCYDEAGADGGGVDSMAALPRRNPDTEWLWGWALNFCGAKAKASPASAALSTARALPPTGSELVGAALL